MVNVVVMLMHPYGVYVPKKLLYHCRHGMCI